MNWAENDALDAAASREDAEKSAKARTAIASTAAGDLAYALMANEREIELLEGINDTYKEKLLSELEVDLDVPGETFVNIGPLDITIKVGERSTWDQDKLAAMAVTSVSFSSIQHKFTVDTKALAKADPAERMAVEACRTLSTTKPKISIKER